MGFRALKGVHCALVPGFGADPTRFCQSEYAGVIECVFRRHSRTTNFPGLRRCYGLPRTFVLESSSFHQQSHVLPRFSVSRPRTRIATYSRGGACAPQRIGMIDEKVFEQVQLAKHASSA